MAEMSIALGTAGFDARHPMAVIADFTNCLLIDGCPKAGPAAAGIVFLIGVKQGATTTNARVTAGRLILVIFASEGRLGAAFSCDAILLGRQFLLPVFVTFHDFILGIPSGL